MARKRKTGVIGYTRVSSDEQAANGVSLDAQRHRIKSYCEAHGLTLLRVEEDAGISGRRTRNRPALQRALKALAKGESAALVAIKLDRLSRTTRDVLDLVARAGKEGWALHSIEERLDTSSPQGRFVVTILGAIAQLEREQASERTRQAQASGEARVGPAAAGLAFRGGAAGEGAGGAADRAASQAAAGAGAGGEADRERAERGGDREPADRAGVVPRDGAGRSAADRAGGVVDFPPYSRGGRPRATLPGIPRTRRARMTRLLLLLVCGTSALSGCVQAKDVRSRLLASAAAQDPDFPDGEDVQLVKFAYIGSVDTRDGPVHVVERTAVITGMHAPRGISAIDFYDQDHNLLASCWSRTEPLWCEGSRVYLAGRMFEGPIPLDPEIRHLFAHDEAPGGNVIELRDGFGHAVLTLEKRYGSSGGIEDDP